MIDTASSGTDGALIVHSGGMPSQDANHIEPDVLNEDGCKNEGGCHCICNFCVLLVSIGIFYLAVFLFKLFLNILSFVAVLCMRLLTGRKQSPTQDAQPNNLEEAFSHVNVPEPSNPGDSSGSMKSFMSMSIENWNNDGGSTGSMSIEADSSSEGYSFADDANVVDEGSLSYLGGGDGDESLTSVSFSMQCNCRISPFVQKRDKAAHKKKMEDDFKRAEAWHIWRLEKKMLKEQREPIY